MRGEHFKDLPLLYPPIITSEPYSFITSNKKPFIYGSLTGYDINFDQIILTKNPNNSTTKSTTISSRHEKLVCLKKADLSFCLDTNKKKSILNIFKVKNGRKRHFLQISGNTKQHLYGRIFFEGKNYTICNASTNSYRICSLIDLKTRKVLRKVDLNSHYESNCYPRFYDGSFPAVSSSSTERVTGIVTITTTNCLSLKSESRELKLDQGQTNWEFWLDSKAFVRIFEVANSISLILHNFENLDSKFYWKKEIEPLPDKKLSSVIKINQKKLALLFGSSKEWHIYILELDLQKKDAKLEKINKWSIPLDLNLEIMGLKLFLIQEKYIGVKGYHRWKASKEEVSKLKQDLKIARRGPMGALNWNTGSFLCCLDTKIK